MHSIARRTLIPCLVLATTASWASAATTAGATTPAQKQKTFDTPEQASEALIAAARDVNVEALTAILGPSGVDLVVTHDPVLDKNQATAFAAKAGEAHHVVRDEKHPNTATLNIGNDDWPMPIPLVQEGKQWRFDTKAGREEILFRRIGNNELDAIEVCRGYVEAQEEYSAELHDDAVVAQYAQHVISAPGRHNGLAWRDPDGSWQGPVGEEISRAIAEGYVEGIQPYHGYYFKILKGQGSHARMGRMDYVVNGVMIGGFALVAAPAEYRITGVKTFLVNHDGIVYEKDLGPHTAQAYKELSRFDPDATWHAVPEP